MLLVVLTLVVLAGGVLVTSVLADRPEWSWLSVLLSALGALLLVLERLRRRREASSPPPETGSGRHRAAQGSAESGPQAGPGSTAVRTGGAESAGGTAEIAAQSAEVDEDPDEPGAEEPAEADAQLVSASDEEVVVVDERPRYHLVGCRWLGSHELLGLPVKEARSLGFTPCARCTPDSVLAEQLRAHRR